MSEMTSRCSVETRRAAPFMGRCFRTPTESDRRRHFPWSWRLRHFCLPSTMFIRFSVRQQGRKTTTTKKKKKKGKQPTNIFASFKFLPWCNFSHKGIPGTSGYWAVSEQLNQTTGTSASRLGPNADGGPFWWAPNHWDFHCMWHYESWERSLIKWCETLEHRSHIFRVTITIFREPFLGVTHVTWLLYSLSQRILTWALPSRCCHYFCFKKIVFYLLISITFGNWHSVLFFIGFRWTA